SVTIFGFKHTYYSDLRAFLSKGTTTVQLFRSQSDGATFTQNGRSNLDGNYTFATTGNNWYDQPNPVPSATYASFQAWSAFNGSALDGTWTLKVEDRKGGPAVPGSF
ncbi:MAG: hypothetical protein ACKOQ2_15480, partial [Dolichospermum sp.]